MTAGDLEAPSSRVPLTIGARIGGGGGGDVHRATWGDRLAAVKVLHPELALSPRERDRFFDEAARMRRVAHPGLVELYDVGQLADGRPYLVMPLLDGETLNARILRAPLDLHEIRCIVDDLAGAVEAMHAAGLVHRDLKPENVMLVGSPARAVLLDFGIARDLSASPSTTTQAGGVRGTPAYMAAERFFGARATPASDIYELAVTVYAMLERRLPWDAQDVEARIAPRPLGDAAPPAVADLIAQALSTRPDARPSSARAFAAAFAYAATSAAPGPRTRDASLLAFRPTESVPAPPRSTTVEASRSRASSARRWGAVALFAVLATAVIFLAIFIAARWGAADPSCPALRAVG